MKGFAAVAVEPGRVEFREVEVPEPGPEDVVIRVMRSWISNGTEGSFIRGERIGGDTPRRATDPLPFPHVPGYQKVGVVAGFGARVRGLKPGQMVFATVSRVEGMFYGTGGHVSPAITHQSQVWPLPEGLNPVAASGLVLTQVGYNCGIRAPVEEGQAAIVIGDGMVGHWTAQTLQHRGARVALFGRHRERLRLFELGVGGLAVDVGEVDPVVAARDFASDGIAIVVDTVGSIPAVEALLPLMRRFGHLVSAGFYGAAGQIDIQLLRNQELSLHAPSGWTSDRIASTLDLVARGVIQTQPLITHRFPARRAAEAFELVLSRVEPVLGVVLDW